eukprot:COSAG06_NODE_51044_length_314_cov_1.567442_1_plen_42_part_10
MIELNLLVLRDGTVQMCCVHRQWRARVPQITNGTTIQTCAGK